MMKILIIQESELILKQNILKNHSLFFDGYLLGPLQI